MELFIGEEYRLTSDKLNIVVGERYEKKDGRGKHGNPTGEFGYKDIGYFSNLESACNFLLDHVVKSSDIRNAAELKELIQTYRNDVKRLTEKINNKQIGFERGM